MDISVGFEKLECSGNKKVKFQKILGQDYKELELPKNTSIKLIAEYEVDQNYVNYLSIYLFLIFK